MFPFEVKGVGRSVRSVIAVHSPPPSCLASRTHAPLVGHLTWVPLPRVRGMLGNDQIGGARRIAQATLSRPPPIRSCGRACRSR